MREWKFILNGKRPEACSNVKRWGEWMEKADRHVAQTDVGECWVSTIFLGIDHSFMEEGAPVVFETMAFTAPIERKVFGRWMPVRDEIAARRYRTWEEAEEGHLAVVIEVRALLARIEEDVTAGLARIARKERTDQ